MREFTDEELISCLTEYFSIEPYLLQAEAEAGGIRTTRVANDLPTPVGWCARYGWSERRLSERLGRTAELQEVAEVCAARMKNHLIVNGLNKGSYEASFAILAVKNLGGWSEKSEVVSHVTQELTDADRRMLARAGVMTLEDATVIDTGVTALPLEADVVRATE